MLRSVNKLGYSEMKDIDPRRKGQNVASMTSKLTENLNVIHKFSDKWTQRPVHLSQPQEVKLNADCVTMKNIEKDAMALSEELMQKLQDQGSIRECQIIGGETREAVEEIAAIIHKYKEYLQPSSRLTSGAGSVTGSIKSTSRSLSLHSVRSSASSTERQRILREEIAAIRSTES